MPEPVTLYVCTTCRAAGDTAEPRAGTRLLAALAQALEERPGAEIRLEAVECLSVCKRPCTVAVASAGRWTYVYGDLDPVESAATILDGVIRYAATGDGIVPWRERSQAFKSGVVARIPPFPNPFPNPSPNPLPKAAE